MNKEDFTIEKVITYVMGYLNSLPDFHGKIWVYNSKFAHRILFIASSVNTDQVIDALFYIDDHSGIYGIQDFVGYIRTEDIDTYPKEQDCSLIWSK